MDQNHWVSLYTDSKEVCGACGETIPNASGRGNVQITGHCKGPPQGATLVMCIDCAHKPPLDGKYALRELPLPHAGFCSQCLRFVGDSYVAVDRELLANAIIEAQARAAKLAQAEAEQRAMMGELEQTLDRMPAEELDRLAEQGLSMLDKLAGPTEPPPAPAPAPSLGRQLDDYMDKRTDALRLETRIAQFETVRVLATLAFAGFVLWLLEPRVSGLVLAGVLLLGLIVGLFLYLVHRSQR